MLLFAFEPLNVRIAETCRDAPPGMTSFDDRGNYLVHWRHETNGEWRIVGDAPVSEVPLPAVER